jgi:hypothetical protein
MNIRHLNPNERTWCAVAKMLRELQDAAVTLDPHIPRRARAKAMLEMNLKPRKSI